MGFAFRFDWFFKHLLDVKNIGKRKIIPNHQQMCNFHILEYFQKNWKLLKRNY